MESEVPVGALPDMVTFTPDGTKLLVANEGEADNGVDPRGSVSIIDISGGIASATVTTAVPESPPAGIVSALIITLAVQWLALGSGSPR